MANKSSLDFILLTDNPKLRSKTWDIRLIEPVLPNDLIRSQRHLKILGHHALKGFQQTLYIDNSILLTAPAEKVFERYAGEAALAMMVHSFRENVLAEFAEVTVRLLDDPELVAKQKAHYENNFPKMLMQKPYSTGIHIKDHSNPNLNSLMKVWYDEVIQYSRRDQLSINAAIELSGVRVFDIEVDNYKSWFHRWPVSRNRQHSIRHWGEIQPITESDTERISPISSSLKYRMKRLRGTK